MRTVEPYGFSLENPKNDIRKILDEKNVMDDILFWKTIKPSISDKLVARDGVHLTRKDKIV